MRARKKRRALWRRHPFCTCWYCAPENRKRLAGARCSREREALKREARS